MENTPDLPKQLCHLCVSHATDILPFLKLCRESAEQWNYLSERLLDISIDTKANTALIHVTDGHVRTTVERRDRTYNSNLKNVKNRFNRLRSETTRKRPVFRKAVPIEELEKARQWKLSLYTCEECGSEYKKLCKINLHLSNQNKRICGHCHKVVNLKTFGEHLKTHMIPFYKCEICDLAFEYEDHFEKHKKVHKGRNMCSECKRTFLTADMLTLHVHRRHEADYCIGCNQRFSNRICLYKHRNKCRSWSMKKYICDYCSKEFDNRCVIKSHITLFHSKKLMHQCEKCGKKFNSACHLEEHYESHDVILDRYVCQYCNRIYSTSGGYRRHMRLKHYNINPHLKRRENYACNICRKDFISVKNLNKHLKAKNHSIKRKSAMKRKI